MDASAHVAAETAVIRRASILCGSWCGAVLARVVKASASLTFNHHVGQPSPIDSHDERSVTTAAAERGRVDGVATKRYGVVRRGIDYAGLGISANDPEPNCSGRTCFLTSCFWTPFFHLR
jgi:hypothetical protein